MALNESDFELKIASSQEEILSSQRLRFKVFVEELGAQSNADNHDLKIETDEYDKWFEHLILIDRSIDPATMDHVVGVYRLLRGDIALDNCGFYSDAEFDLTPLINSGRKLLELGRSCVHPNYRSGIAMYHLWNRLAQYVIENNIEILFGVASFHGINPMDYAHQLAYLHQNHLAPEDLRVSVRNEQGTNLDLIPADQIDQKKALLDMPSLIRGYLRLGGFVGNGAFLDYSFNTIDVCIVIDTNRMATTRREFFHRSVGSNSNT